MGAIAAPDVARVQAALSRLDAAAVAERIEPDSYLGTLVAAIREVVEALHAQVGPHTEQLQALTMDAKSAADTSLAIVREAAEALRVELAKIDRHIALAQVQLGAKEADTIKTMVDGIAAKLETATVIRAKAYDRTSYLRTAGALAAVAVMLLAVGAGGWAAVAGRPSDTGLPAAAFAECLASATRDQASGRMFCVIGVPGTPRRP